MRLLSPFYWEEGGGRGGKGLCVCMCVWNLLPNFQKRGGDLTGPSFLQGDWCERGGDLSTGETIFYIKIN